MSSLSTKAELADEETGGKDTDFEDDALLDDVDDDALPLAQLFNEARAIVQRLMEGEDEPKPKAVSSGKAAQDPVARALEVLEKCAVRLRQGAYFSANEELDDVKTEDLPYLLLEHFRAELLPKSTSTEAPVGAGASGGGRAPPFDPMVRLRLLRASSKAHGVFLAQCDALGVINGPEKQFYDAQQEAAAVASGAANAADDDEEDDADSGAAGGGRRGFKSGGSGLVRYSGSGGEGRSTGYGSGFVDGNLAIDPNAQRLNKMARFKRQRDRQNQLATAKAALRATATRAVPDEDRQREIGLLELQTAVANSLDEMDAHQKELVMLNMMAQRIRPSNGSGVMGSSGQFTDSRAPPSSRGGGSNSGDGGSYMVGSSPSASGSVIYDPKDPARPGLSVTHMNLDPSTGALRSRAETVKAGVFQPGHRQPTMTLEEFADREVADAMARSAREAAAPPPPRRIKQLEDDGDEDDEALVEAAAYLDRDWDQFKEDNPFGSGNKANKRC